MMRCHRNSSAAPMAHALHISRKRTPLSCASRSASCSGRPDSSCRRCRRNSRHHRSDRRRNQQQRRQQLRHRCDIRAPGHSLTRNRNLRYSCGCCCMCSGRGSGRFPIRRACCPRHCQTQCVHLDCRRREARRAESRRLEGRRDEGRQREGRQQEGRREGAPPSRPEAAAGLARKPGSKGRSHRGRRRSPERGWVYSRPWAPLIFPNLRAKR